MKVYLVNCIVYYEDYEYDQIVFLDSYTDIFSNRDSAEFALEQYEKSLKNKNTAERYFCYDNSVSIFEIIEKEL